MGERVDEIPEGFGCKPAAQAFGLISAFAVIAATVGISIALRDGCTGICETAGFTLYAAGLPASAIFAVIAGDLPVAWPLDITLWLIISAGASRFSERRRLSVNTVAFRVIVIALVYGFIASLFIEAV